LNALKITVITPCYNPGPCLEHCINSVISQSHNNIEYIVIDGGSTDATLQIISQYNSYVNFFVSEPDNGIYDAINKGIAKATGDVIGVLNADDVFASPDVLKEIADSFGKSGADVVYGNLNYINPKGGVIRRWRAGNGSFNWGWMPPHPTFYCRRELFEKFGAYRTDFGTAGDYELMLRMMHLNKVKAYHLDKVIVNMSLGGVSNRSISNRIKAWKNDHSAMRKNGVLFPLMAIIFKPLRKVFQYI